MKTTMAVLFMVLAILAVSVPGAYARDNHGYYTRRDVKSETKKVEKGIEITLTSTDPQVVRRLQEDIQYYESALADEYYYGNDDYAAGDVKTEIKKTDKGIRISLTSEDAQTARQIQADAAYYESTLSDEGYYCRHGEMAGRRMAVHHCCNCGW